MKERIKEIMDAENMTPARFADSLQIGRAVISHILNGRNNPSLDVITRILSQMPKINSDWLLTGNGSMYKNQQSAATSTNFTQEKVSPATDLFQQDLFAENQINQPPVKEEPEYSKENVVNKPENPVQEVITERIIYKERPEKKIIRIIIYYSDNTFETFDAGKL